MSLVAHSVAARSLGAFRPVWMGRSHTTCSSRDVLRSFLSSSIPRKAPSSYFKEAEKATQKWIDDIIVKKNLYPFAKQSKNEIVVCPPRLSAAGVASFITSEVKNFAETKSPPGKNLCRLLVFPVEEYSHMFALRRFAPRLKQIESECNGLWGWAGQYQEARDEKMTVQATFFRSSSDPMHLFQTLTVGQIAPCYTMQLVKFKELKKVRGREPELRSLEIFACNLRVAI